MPADVSDRSQKGRARFPRPLLLSAIFALLSTLLLAFLLPLLAPGLLRFEHAMGDLRTAWMSDRLPSQHPLIAVVGVTDETLNGYKARLPIDPGVLARTIDAIDAAGAKAIGLDVLFVRTARPDHEGELIAAIRRAKAKIVLAAADERVFLSPQQRERQQAFFRDGLRPAGYANLAVERDFIVRFKAQPFAASAFPKSFAEVLAENSGYASASKRRRIAWLRTPADQSDTFLTLSADTLLRPAGDALLNAAKQGLKGKIVILAGMLTDIDMHRTPLQPMHGALIHAQILASIVDGRSIGQIESGTLALPLTLAAITGLGFLVGWYFRYRRRGLLASGAATAVIIAVDTLVFWQFRIILPLVLALMAWFLGEFSGHYLGRWLGYNTDRSRWFVR
ncbi:MAG: CHASE2 domain-containing protein [Hyphomicrobiaceae bacterium]